MRAGIGRSGLTPPLGVELAGYGYYLERKAETVNDPLYARALLLEDGAKRMVLVSCDLLGLSRGVCDEVRAHAREALGCAPENVMIVSTHTHTGPAIKYHEGCGATDAGYLAVVGKRICGALDAALENIGEVTALSFVKRTLEGDYIYNRANPDGPVDRELRGFILRRGAQRPLAVLSAASHGVFRGRVPDVSADFAGEVNRLAAQAGFDSIYINGLCGDIDPYQPSPERLAAFAAQIAALPGAEERPLERAFSCGRIDFTLHHTAVTPEEIRGAAKEAVQRAGGPQEPAARVALAWERDMVSHMDALKEEETLFADYLVLGGIPVLALPFEGFTNIGMDIRAQLSCPDALVLGCAEELMGYLPTKDDFRRGAYAALESTFLYKRLPVRPGEAERLGAELGRQMKEKLN